MVDTLPTGLHIQSKYSDAKTYTLTSGRAHTINKERCYASTCSMSLVGGFWLFWWGYLFTRLLGADPDPQCPDDTDLTCLHWQKVASLWKKTPTKANGIWRWGKKLSWSVSLTYPSGSTPQMKIGRYFVGLFGSFLASYNCSIGRLRSGCWVLTKYRHSETGDYNPWVKRPKLSQFLTLRGDGPSHPSCKMEPWKTSNGQNWDPIEKCFSWPLLEPIAFFLKLDPQNHISMEWTEHCLLCVSVSSYLGVSRRSESFMRPLLSNSCFSSLHTHTALHLTVTLVKSWIYLI